MPKQPTTPPTEPAPAPQPPTKQPGDDAPLALGITSLLIWMTLPLLGSVIGIIIAAVGLSEAKKQHGRGYGLNVAGLITNICLTVLQVIALAVIIILIIIGISAEAGSDYYETDSPQEPDSSLEQRDQQHT